MSIKLREISNNVQNISKQYFEHMYYNNEPSFKLDAKFLEFYKNKKPKFGFNGLGEFVFYRTYPRIKDDGNKETFLDCLCRSIEGCYEIQRRHCRKIHIPWDYDKAQLSAQEMFQRMWEFKFLPPGRGLWMMGTKFMWERGSAALCSCAFVSTDDKIEADPAEPFCFMMDMSMLGVGVGFDTKGADKIKILKPIDKKPIYQICDSREGWVDSVRILIWSYTKKPEYGYVEYDYSEIRKAGSDIKGFGGKASGPEILKELHGLIRNHLNKKIGSTLSSVDITDIMNYIGRCVVAGNVRRTAQLSLGEFNDHAYCSMKNPIDSLNECDYEHFNNTIERLYNEERNHAILDDFRIDPLKLEKTFKENGKKHHCLVGSTKPDKLLIPKERLLPAIEVWNALNQHRWASNNSLFAEIGMDYREPVKRTIVNGEPGYQWLDNIRDYGRMIDGRQPGIDGRAKGVNPCFPGNMRLFTEEGYVNIYDLWLSGGSLEYQGIDDAIIKYGSQMIVNNNGIVESSKVYRTGSKIPIYRVTFSDNSWIDATKNHKMITVVRNPSKKKGKITYIEFRKNISDLAINDMIPLNRMSHFGTFHDPTYAELAGWCIGDGSLSPKKDSQVRAECTCYNEDIKTILPKLRGLLYELYITHNKSTNQNPIYAGWVRNQDYFEHREERIGSNVLGRLLKLDGIKSGDKHNIPLTIWGGTKETVAAFLRGLVSADGFILVNEKKKTISARINQSNKKLLQDCRLLLNQFGIAGSVRRRKISSKQLMNDGKGGKKLYNCKTNYELIISGIVQVRRFIDNIGFIQESKMTIAKKWLSEHHGSNNSNTGKYVKIKSVKYIGDEDTYCLTEPKNNRIVVEGYQVAQCGEQSLESFELCNLCETFPANHENADDYMRTLKFAYLYAKTVTLLPTHNPRTNQVTLRNRRIGLSQSGIIRAFAKFGRRTMLKDFCDAGYNEIRRWDEIYSEWLCVQKSIKTTSIKPSGSISLVVGEHPGIHHPETLTCWRRVRVAKDNPLVDILKKAGYHIEPDFKDPNRTVVVKFAVSDESVRAITDVSIWEQIINVVDYQRLWSDNQVSATIKFKPEEAHEIVRILETFEDQLKGISFLPQNCGSYKQAPYESCTPEEVIEYNSKLSDIDYSSFIGQDAEGTKFCDSDKCTL